MCYQERRVFFPRSFNVFNSLMIHVSPYISARFPSEMSHMDVMGVVWFPLNQTFTCFHSESGWQRGREEWCSRVLAHAEGCKVHGRWSVPLLSAQRHRRGWTAGVSRSPLYVFTSLLMFRVVQSTTVKTSEVETEAWFKPLLTLLEISLETLWPSPFYVLLILKLIEPCLPTKPCRPFGQMILTWPLFL